MTSYLGEADLRARQHEVLADFDLLDPPADALLVALTTLAAAVAGVGHAAVNLLDTDSQLQLSTSGDGWISSPRAESMCTVATRTGALGEVVHVPDTSLDARFATNPWVDGRRGGVRLYASAPLVAEGTTVGSLCVFDDAPGQLAPGQLARLSDLADVVVALLERRRANRRSEAARAELLVAHDDLRRTKAFAEALLESLPVGVVAADAARRVTLFNKVSRLWHGHDTDAGLSPEDFPTAYDLFEADGVTTLAVDRVPLLRVYEEGRVGEAEIVIHPHGREPRTVSCSGTQITDGEGRFLGAVVAMADVTEQRVLEHRLRAAALHDPLTGLPNRSLLMDRLDHALQAAERESTPVAVLYCDLDGFKVVNDGHGHAVGDDVLVQAARRLEDAVRPGDSVARIGGDEFVLLCPGVEGVAAAQVIADRVTNALAEPLRSTAGEHHVGISVGIALSGADSRSETLLSSADHAMYRVKRGRGDGSSHR